MKPLILFFLTLTTGITFARAQGSTDSIVREINSDIYLTDEKVTQLIFPGNIEKWRGGFDPELFVTEVYRNILYLQPLTEFTPSNVHVITEDGSHFTIKIKYNHFADRSTFIYALDDAVFSRRDAMQPADLQAAGSLSGAAALPSADKAAIPKSEPIKDPLMLRIMDDKDFIVNRSGVRYKNVQFKITGIYYHNDLIYFKCKVSNSTNIPYEFDYIGFNLQTRKQRKASTANTEEIMPVSTYYESNAVSSVKEIACIFVFNKFTIGDTNLLSVSIVEKDGGRNMSLEITDDIILQAKKL